MKKSLVTLAFIVGIIVLIKDLIVKTQDAIYRPGQIFTVSSGIVPLSCVGSVGSMFIRSVDGSLFICRPVGGANIFVPLAATPIPAKTITGIQNNIFTDVLMITVPNAASGALIEVLLEGSLGSGGVIGQYEASIGRSVFIQVTRVPGLNTDATITTLQNAPNARVTGATTMTQSTQLSAMVGLPTAQQTFTLQYQITRGNGASNNHIASVISRIISPTLTNITIQ